jgi:hypothetical protein
METMINIVKNISTFFLEKTIFFYHPNGSQILEDLTSSHLPKDGLDLLVVGGRNFCFKINRAFLLLV